jgi:type II secretion system protein G
MKNHHKNGFTIIELIVVISIISLLASIVLVNVNGYLAKARDARRAADIAQLQKALEMYYADHGQYPISGGAIFPVSSFSNSNDGSWGTLQTLLQPYMPKLPTDPKQSVGGWPGDGSSYSYAYDSAAYGGCAAQQWYMLFFRPEDQSKTRPNVAYCTDGGGFENYSGSVITIKCAYSSNCQTH